MITNIKTTPVVKQDYAAPTAKVPNKATNIAISCLGAESPNPKTLQGRVEIGSQNLTSRFAHTLFG